MKISAHLLTSIAAVVGSTALGSEIEVRSVHSLGVEVEYNLKNGSEAFCFLAEVGAEGWQATPLSVWFLPEDQKNKTSPDIVFADQWFWGEQYFVRRIEPNAHFLGRAVVSGEEMPLSPRPLAVFYLNGFSCEDAGNDPSKTYTPSEIDSKRGLPLDVDRARTRRILSPVTLLEPSS